MDAEDATIEAFWKTRATATALPATACWRCTASACGEWAVRMDRRLAAPV